MVVLQSNYSNEVNAQLKEAQAIVPEQVVGLAYTVEQGKVLLNWEAVVKDTEGRELAVTAYRIFRKETAGGEFTLLASTADGSALSHTDTTAKDGASYLYAVSAVAEEVEGAKSADLAVKTIPSVPTDLVATASETEIRLDWKSVKNEADVKLNENLAGYNVYRSEQSGSGYEKIGSADAVSTTYTDDTAEEGKTYFYVITAFDNSAA